MREAIEAGLKEKLGWSTRGKYDIAPVHVGVCDWCIVRIDTEEHKLRLTGIGDVSQQPSAVVVVRWPDALPEVITEVAAVFRRMAKHDAALREIRGLDDAAPEGHIRRFMDEQTFFGPM